MKTIVIEQPNYVPWLGYFDLIRQSDVWVWLDDVQYTKRDWRNRNRIGTRDQEVWLSIPVRTKGRRDQRICDAEISSFDWVAKHLRSLEHAYASAPFFAQLFPLVAAHLERLPRRLVDLTIPLNEALCELLELRPRFVRSSALEGIEGRKQARLLSICARFDCQRYLSGPAAQAYIDPVGFRERGYVLSYIHYDYPSYPRGEGQRLEGLSILDPLFWVGPQETRRLLSGQAEPEQESPCPTS